MSGSQYLVNHVLQFCLGRVLAERAQYCACNDKDDDRTINCRCERIEYVPKKIIPALDYTML